MAERPDRYPWLDLLEVDGPFLSRPALDDVYDEAWPPKISNEQREALDLPPALPSSWDDAAMAQVDSLLTDVLGYREGRTLKFNPGTVIHPVYDNAAVTPHAAVYSRRDPDKPRLVVLAGPAAAETPDALDPQAITTHYGWPSTAVQRAALAARGLKAELALVTNGYQHLIVWVGSGITGHAWVDPSLYRLDRRLADAFVALLSAASVTTDADTSTADLLRLSQDKQLDVTEKLGIQVRQAAEALVNAVSRANRNTDGKLLAGVAPDEVYAGVVTVLMRTVFLLNAEERDLISSGDLWDRSYSVVELLDRLDDDHYRHQGVMRRRHGAWLRMLAAAHAVHGGVNHSQMNVPAYGGNLFDPVRHPFLEGMGVAGEVFDVGVVDDATTRNVLGLLQRLNGQRLSYRAFSVEQIGQVYESLLDHSAVSVPEGRVVLGLVGGKGAEPEVALTDLEEQHTKGSLADWLAKNHDPSSGQGKMAKWQGRIDRTPDERVTATLAQACHGNGDILARVENFAGLLRTDARDVALVFLPGDVYVTETANRRDTGTAYTSPEFAAEIAHHALEHLVYEPGPHNEEDESNWQIKPPDEILELRVCDPAVGSGAILVAAVRFLADKLVESRLEYGELTARDLETAAADPMATDPHVQARRDVVAQCIYAVDRDPMAVEMAKLSLWLITMANGRPFTFLDHAIKCGDSLLGVTSLDQLRRLHLDESVGTQIGLDLERGRSEGLGGYFTMIDERINQAQALRELVRDGDVKDAVDAQQRAELNAKADRLLDDLRLVADAITATCHFRASDKSGSTEAALQDRVLPLAADLEDSRGRLAALGQFRPPNAPSPGAYFHWVLEFPEIVESGGFDAMVANPPFQGGTLISAASGDQYLAFLKRYLAEGASTNRADLVVFFFRRASQLSTSLAFISTNSIREGDSQEFGLRVLLRGGWAAARAVPEARWPGTDNVYVSMVWLTRVLQVRPVLVAAATGPTRVDYISSALNQRRSADVTPIRLQGAPFAQNGVQPGGDGLFVDLESEFASSPYARPIVNGVSAQGRGVSSQAALDFTGLTESEVQALELEAPIVARQHAAVLSTTYTSWKKCWWEFRSPRRRLRERVDELGTDEVLAVVRVSKHCVPLRVRSQDLWTDSLVVFASVDDALFAILHSELHWWWVVERSSKLKSDLRYSTTDCLETFPLIEPTASLRKTGDQLRQVRRELEVREGGLTAAMNCVHDETTVDDLVVGVREALQSVNQSVAKSLALDIQLKLDFFEVGGRPKRFTLPPEAVDTVLDGLLELNIQQAAEQTGRSLEAVMREAQHG